ncbi:MAG TPA: hypothetical protein VEA79_06645 [Phenylobacterium sp.]|nr:hypothetical protein [Phenylobacterium sp.]
MTTNDPNPSTLAEAPAALVYLVQGEHWHVPGFRMTAHSSEGAAQSMAASIVQELRADYQKSYDDNEDLPPLAAPSGSWVSDLADLNRALFAAGAAVDANPAKHEDQCDVWVTRLPLDLPATPETVEATPPLRVGVSISGGVCQSVWSDQPVQNLSVTIFDFDAAEESDLERVTLVDFNDGRGEAPAYVSTYGAEGACETVYGGEGLEVSPFPTMRPASDEEQDAGAIARAAEPSFERAKLAGYEVHDADPPFGWDRAFEAIEPGGRALGFYASERRAWEACDNHRMFGDT